MLEEYAHKIARPVYYINSPDDLVCASPYMHYENGEGQLMKGPGGPFYNFLMAHPNDEPLIIVNYANFSADDIVRFNTLLDKKPKADGIDLPESTQIIGLINPNQPTAYQGEDFYSRFDKVSTTSYTRKQWEDSLIPLPFLHADQITKKYDIHLYHYPDWQERLLGRWVLHKDRFVFEEGELINALQTGLPLAIHNGLWNDPKFQLFWQQALMRGFIDYEGGRLFIPDNLKLIPCEGYDWENIRPYVSFNDNVSSTHALNPGQLGQFFRQYECDNINQTLDTVVGLIAQHANNCLQVHVTRNLSEDEWAMVLYTCQKYNVRLQCSCAPSIVLPPPLQAVGIKKEASLWQEWQVEATDSTQVIESNDVDTTAALLVNGENDWQVIEISECSGSDLLWHIHSEQDPQTLRFKFHESPKAILTALEENKKVLLKGAISPELADSLANFLLQRQNEMTAKSKLVILSEQTSCLDYLPRHKHQVNKQDKRQVLAKTYTSTELDTLSPEQWENESLSQLQARLTHQRIYPQTTCTDDAWLGLLHLPGKINLKDFDATNSVQIAQDFNQNRLNAVNQILTHTPYVFLTGLTGTGKSTFVEKNFQNDQDALYQGENRILDWAKDSSKKRKILFIDEANLSPHQWSEFEGLFNNPPAILISGVYHPLDANHKVIFAGNPLSYGDARQLSPFFQRHGNALVFEPMPLEFIYESILKPVFENTPHYQNAMELCAPMLEIYRFICDRSDKEVLISPRELQMMALKVLAYAHSEQAGFNECLIAAHHYTYEIAKDLIPVRYQNEFNSRFTPGTPLLRTKTSINQFPTSDFLITPSREPLRAQLIDLLNLREFRRIPGCNEAQRYGGLGGIVIEGEPGIGKSELVTHTLISQGYQEVHDYDPKSTKPVPDKAFYHMPVSLSPSDKKDLLLKAFHEGAVVVVDEINSSPMMERLLNDLLSGFTPDKKRPNKPGFLVIGTQNPVTMAGRRAPSTALARRLITTTLPPLSNQEMKDILITKGVSTHDSSLLVEAFEKNLKKAKIRQLKPLPTFRDLLKEAELLSQSKKLKRHLPSTKIITRDKRPKNEIDKSRLIRTSSMKDSFFAVTNHLKTASDVTLTPPH